MSERVRGVGIISCSLSVSKQLNEPRWDSGLRKNPNAPLVTHVKTKSLVESGTDKGKNVEIIHSEPNKNASELVVYWSPEFESLKVSQKARPVYYVELCLRDSPKCGSTAG